MSRSRLGGTFVPILFMVIGVFGLFAGRTDAQAPAAPKFPVTVPASPGPKTNLFRHVMKKDEVLAALAQVKESQDLFVKSNGALTLRVSSNTTKLPWKLHTDADELWFVYRGSAKVSLAPFSLQVGVTPPGETYDVGEGDIVNVPRHLAYQILPNGGRFEYVALRKFALQIPGASPARGGGGPQKPIPTLTKKAELDQFFSTSIASSALFPGINRIIYYGGPGGAKYGDYPGGPVENHEIDEHIYFIAHGQAKATLDGFITNAYWDRRGLFGTGVVGGSEYTVGPGDIIFVFRNTLHYIVPLPTTGKVGYLLVDLPESEAYWPKSIVPNGAGAY
jgi:mannose-6-phosphate isomerase-like protein (cupin superfamily)